MKANDRVDLGLLILRIGLGLTALFYGSQKMLGVFGGPGIQGTIGFMQHMFGIPPVFAVLAACGEFFGGLGILFGFLTPVAAFGFACVMAVATFEGWKTPGLFHSVFVGPGNPTDPVKVFYSFSLFCAAVAVMMMGAGKYSIDGKLFLRKSR